MRILLIPTLVSVLCAAPSVAQNAQQPFGLPAGQLQAATDPNPVQQPADAQNAQSFEQSARNMLVGAGFTDVKMVPLSFGVRANDAGGNPVALLVTPDGISVLRGGPQSTQPNSTMSTPSR